MSVLRSIDAWGGGTWVGVVFLTAMCLGAGLIAIAMVTEQPIPTIDCCPNGDALGAER